MHGNTFLTPSGVKTRRFEDILAEITSFFAVHKAEGTVPGGVHLEITPQTVTECLGGTDDVQDHHLDDPEAYLSLCDPRLNSRQSLDLVFQLGELLQAYGGAR
jgi:3-deoxy-7-phosphoheptulonate synthase